MKRITRRGSLFSSDNEQEATQVNLMNTTLGDRKPQKGTHCMVTLLMVQKQDGWTLLFRMWTEVVESQGRKKAISIPELRMQIICGGAQDGVMVEKGGPQCS